MTLIAEDQAARHIMRHLYLSAKMNSKQYISPLTLRQMYRQYSQWRQLVKSRIGWCKTSSEEDRTYEFDSCLVHYLLERCFWIRYGDSDVVSDLLKILFEIDGHLGKIFDCRLPPIKQRRYKKIEVNPNVSEDLSQALNERYSLQSTWKFGTLEQEAVQPLEYFIKHAYKKKVLFDRMRLAEQFILQSRMKTNSGKTGLLFHPPCSIFFKSPNIFCKLLQYGLFATAEPNDENVGRLLTGVVGIWACGGLKPFQSSISIKKSQSSGINTTTQFSDTINTIQSSDSMETCQSTYITKTSQTSNNIKTSQTSASTETHQSTTETSQSPDTTKISHSSDVTQSYARNMLQSSGIYKSSQYSNTSNETLEIAAMLLRAVDRVDISVLMAFQRMRKRPDTISQILTEMSTQNVLPKLGTRCFGPQELQHMCRCRIRRRLYDNWQLPDGISFLPIPTRCKMYLNLQVD